MYQLPQGTKPKKVVLKVADLDKLSEFYQVIIGMKFIKQENDRVFLGAQGSTESLLELRKIPIPQNPKQTAGLYHTAFLLPSRKDLGNVILWLLKNNIELGAGDHGYSEAIYLSDPEGNGIEIYHDRPIEQWDIRPNGEIAGVTEELDGDAIIAEADGNYTGLATGSRIGHIHLVVRELSETEMFLETLGFELKYNFGRQAKFFAAGMYHHHIGTNIWGGKNLPKMTDEQLGLAAYSFELPDQAAFSELIEHLEEKELSYQAKNEHLLELFDPNGTILEFSYKN